MSAEVSQSSIVESEMIKSAQPVAKDCWATLSPLLPANYQV